MPTYEFRCRKCKKEFSVVMKISEHGTKKIECPACGSSSVAQQFTSFFAVTSKKS